MTEPKADKTPANRSNIKNIKEILGKIYLTSMRDPWVNS